LSDCRENPSLVVESNVGLGLLAQGRQKRGRVKIEEDEELENPNPKCAVCGVKKSGARKARVREGEEDEERPREKGLENLNCVG
jgi:hypothetical protein